MDRIDPQHPQPTPTRYPTEPLSPAAAALYRQAAADLEAAARDADRLGAHDRAHNHRQRAAEHRALATAWSDDDNKPVIPKIPRPRKPAPANGDVCPLCEYFRCRCNGVQPGNAHLTRATAGAR